MPQFDSLTEAFEWFWENVYPNLPSEKKTNALRRTKHAYYKGEEKVSTKRMERILAEHTNYKVRYDVEIEK
jgi:hypothetical protein